MAGIPATFVALAVVLFAILPGAIYMFVYGTRVGSYGVGLPDRIFRFLAVSVAFQALFSGLSYYLYKSTIRSGKLVRGEVSAWAIEIFAVCYVAIPLLLGLTVGEAVRRDWLSIRSLAAGSPEPRAWDHLFAGQRPNGIIRARLKSGAYIAGLFGKSADGNKKSHASGYPESGDLYLYESLLVDPTTGEFIRDEQHNLCSGAGGILLRWDEIEFLEIFE